MILKGKPLAELTINKLRQVDAPTKKLVIICISEDRASSIYVEKKLDLARELDVSLEVIRLEGNVTREALFDLIDNLNDNDTVGGVMIQMPIPSHFDRREVCSRISRDKDVDGFSYIITKSGKTLPPTLMAIDCLLDFYSIKKRAKKVLIVGSGFLVGSPLFNFYSQTGINPEMLTEGDQNYSDKLKAADVIILATGGGRTFRVGDFSEGATVIDASTIASDSKLKGDLDFVDIGDEINFSPVPGGVGPVTVSMLFVNFYLLCGRAIEGFDLLNSL